MNKIRIIALVMAVMMLGMCMASCGGSTAEKVTVNANISVMVGEEVLFGPVDMTIEGTTEQVPTVLQLAEEAFTMYEIPHEVNETGISLTSVTIDGTAYANTVTDTEIYTWYYTADGVEPEEGRAGTNALVEGQSIVFIYGSTLINPEDFSDEGGR